MNSKWGRLKNQRKKLLTTAFPTRQKKPPIQQPLLQDQVLNQQPPIQQILLQQIAQELRRGHPATHKQLQIQLQITQPPQVMEHKQLQIQQVIRAETNQALRTEQKIQTQIILPRTK